MLIGIESLNAAKLVDLCGQEVPESQSLDFKLQLPSARDSRARAEFLKDVCAFANASGGDIVYGIKEKDGRAHAVMPLKGESMDAAQRRLGQMCESGLEPRVAGIRFRFIEVDGGYALVLRVPRSFIGPHRYVVDGVARFVTRAGSHTTELSYDQLRQAFDQGKSFGYKAREFRLQRLADITARATWKPSPQYPICALQVVPLASMTASTQVDVQSLYHDYTHLIAFAGGASRSLNLDGLIVYPGGTHHWGSSAYVQVFRNGAIELVRMMRTRQLENVTVLPAVAVSEFFRAGLELAIRAAIKNGSEGPALSACALLELGETQWAYTDRSGFPQIRRTDRADLILPDVWIDDITNVAIDDLARPMLDVLWQAFDWEQCPMYDKAGAFSKR